MQKQTPKTKDFSFKQFKVKGGLSGMPVSTDGVLLGAWVEATPGKSILDIGTGTGLLSLMCAQRFPGSSITAIEIDSHAYQAAKENFYHSPWNKNLKLIQADILSWQADYAFDRIICNPPYFNSGIQSSNQQRSIARHTDALPHRPLLEACKNLLQPGGKANFILPAIEGDHFITLAKRLNWNVSRLCKVSATENKTFNRFLIELSLEHSKKEESELSIHQSGQYSADFIALTKEFYLKM